MTREKWGDVFISDGSIDRLYTHLSDGNFGKFMVKYSLLKENLGSVIGTVRTKKLGFNTDTNEIIFTLHFKKRSTLVNIPDELKGKILLQETSVGTKPEYEGQGVASFAYALLSSKGYAVLSDISHFTDGKMLWNKMAKEAHLSHYEILVLDDEYGFKKNKDGSIVRYAEKNIDSADFWTHGEDYAGYHILFVMVNK